MKGGPAEAQDPLALAGAVLGDFRRIEGQARALLAGGLGRPGGERLRLSLVDDLRSALIRIGAAKTILQDLLHHRGSAQAAARAYHRASVAGQAKRR